MANRRPDAPLGAVLLLLLLVVPGITWLAYSYNEADLPAPEDPAIERSASPDSTTRQADAPTTVTPAAVPLTHSQRQVDTRCTGPERQPAPLPSLDEETINRLLTETASMLAGADDPGHRLAAAILTPSDVQEKIASLSTLDLPESLAPIADWHLLDACNTTGTETGPCETAELAARFVASAPDNGMVHVALAATWYDAGMDDKTLEALERAAVAPMMTEYFAEQFELLDMALQAHGEIETAERMQLIMLRSVLVPNWGVLRICRENVGAPGRWQNSCRELGPRLEHDSASLIGQRVGLVIQKYHAEATGDTAQLAAIESRLAAQDDVREMASAVDDAVMSSERALSVFVDAFRSGNETSAFRAVADELVRQREERDKECG